MRTLDELFKRIDAQIKKARELNDALEKYIPSDKRTNINNKPNRK